MPQRTSTGTGRKARDRSCRVASPHRRLSSLGFLGAVVVLTILGGTPLPACAASPDQASELNQRGVALLKDGQPAEARAVFDQALELKPDFPAALNNRGLTLAIQGQLEEAIAAYRKALEVDPQFRAAHNNLGNALAAQGRLEEAISSYQKALRVQPDAAGARDNASNPTDAEIHFNLSLALLKAGRRQEAARELAIAQQLDAKWTSPGMANVSPPGKSAPRRTPRRFAVQAGAFEDSAKAEALAQELSWRYQYQVGIFPITLRGKTLYRVRIHVETRAEADALAERLPREQNLPAWVVPIH